MKIDDLGSLYSIFNDATGRVQEILNKFKKKLELFYSKLNEIKNDVRFNDELGRPHKPEKNGTPNGCCALLTYNFNKWHQNIFIKEPNESNILNKHWARRKWELNKDEWYRWCYENVRVEGYYYDSWPELTLSRRGVDPDDTGLNTGQELNLTNHRGIDIPHYNRGHVALATSGVVDKIRLNEHTDEDIIKWYEWYERYEKGALGGGRIENKKKKVKNKTTKKEENLKIKKKRRTTKKEKEIIIIYIVYACQ